MKNKKQKLSTLKSILILAQQLQSKYYGKIDIDIQLIGITVDVDVKLGVGKMECFEFSRFDNEDFWRKEYDRLLTYLNEHNE